MATTSSDRTQRAIILASSILGLPLLIGGTVVSERAQRDWYWHYSRSSQAVPIVFSFIPIPLSIAFSAVCLWRSRKQRELCGRDQAIRLLLDLGLSLSYLGVLIPFWVIEPRRLNGRANWMLLEAYASFFLIANMLIHFYLVCRNIKSALASVRSIYSNITISSCPHCHKQLAGPQMSGGRAGREGYSLLHAEDYLDEDAVAFEGPTGPDARRSTESGKSSMDV